jgi:hypothetical protein
VRKGRKFFDNQQGETEERGRGGGKEKRGRKEGERERGERKRGREESEMVDYVSI